MEIQVFVNFTQPHGNDDVVVAVVAVTIFVAAVVVVVVVVVIKNESNNKIECPNKISPFHIHISTQ